MLDERSVDSLEGERSLTTRSTRNNTKQAARNFVLLLRVLRVVTTFYV
jgi:hypothetical protein